MLKLKSIPWHVRCSMFDGVFDVRLCVTSLPHWHPQAFETVIENPGIDPMPFVPEARGNDKNQMRSYRALLLADRCVLCP
jgi:hypothetical protein